MARKRKLLLILLIFSLVKSGLGLWPFSSFGASEICNAENQFGCDCTEPNIVCSSRNLTSINTDTFIIPDETISVDFSLNAITRVPSGLKWPNSILKLYLQHNQIDEIAISAFSNFSLLEYLDLSNNKLTRIEAPILRELTSLNTLDLSHNQLQTVDPDWFGERNNLIRLNLASNSFGDFTWRDETFQRLVWLEFLDLSDCSTGVLPLDIFSNNTRITELRLAKNPLDHIPLTQLHAIRYTLEFLDLTGINVTVIRNHVFHKMEALKKLFLNDMPFLEAVEPLAFHGLHDMEVLELKNNPLLSEIDMLAFYDAVTSAGPNLVQTLDISKNNLKSLHENLLDWSQVNEINLNDNPWHCDCKLAWIVEADLTLSEFLTCATPQAKANLAIMTLSYEDFTCSKSWLERSINVVMGAAITVFLVIFVVAIVLIIKPNYTFGDLRKSLWARNLDDDPGVQYVRLQSMT